MKSGLPRNGSFVALIWLVALCVLLPVQLRSQSFYGSVVGTITDASGASVAGATVTVTDVGTNNSQSARTDSKGNFSFVNLVPANYNVRAEKAGFKAFLG